MARVTELQSRLDHRALALRHQDWISASLAMFHPVSGLRVRLVSQFPIVSPKRSSRRVKFRTSFLLSNMRFTWWLHTWASLF
jgi:hypothetical protein